MRHSTGKRIRFSRITDPVTGHMFIVPMDHSVTLGPLGPASHTASFVRLLADAGAGAVVLHRGRVRHVDPAVFASLGLVVHLSAGTELSLDRDAKVLVSGVDDAMRLGADAVSVHVNVGSDTEARQLADFAAVSRECETVGMPLLAMMYARGRERPAPTPSGDIAHLASIATDLGADIVKVDYPGSPEALAAVAATCPIPLCVAGGGRLAADDDVVDFARTLLASGAGGLCFGRNVFEAADPLAVATGLARLVRGDAEPHAVRPAHPQLELA
ncbi:transaldolase [Rhodococcus rhodnii]|nr:transaldolase [Rhodococcus rhodnii]